LRGRSREFKLSANSLMDLIEDRSSFRTSTRASSSSLRISCLASFAATMFLAAIMTWALCKASTLVVSKPIPLAPPASKFISDHSQPTKTRWGHSSVQILREYILQNPLKLICTWEFIPVRKKLKAGNGSEIR